MSTENVNKFDFAEKRRRISAERLQEARKTANYNQDRVAKILHKDRTSISNWERGHSTPSVDDYFVLALLYDTSIIELMAIDAIWEESQLLNYENQKISELNSQVNEISNEVYDAVGKQLPRGANLESLRSSVRLIQSFLESFDDDLEEIRNEKL